MTSARLVSVGNVLVDLTVRVPALPPRGGDVLGAALPAAAGGSLNVLVAAARQGLPAAYAGGHGTGPFGDLVRAALAADDIDALLPAHSDLDTGYTVAMVEPDGERTFVTVFGAEAQLDLDGFALAPDDVLHVSGYGLLPSTNGDVLASWLPTVAGRHLVLVDPGPLVRDIRSPVLETALASTDWLSLNAREASLLTGVADARQAIEALPLPRAGIVLRRGANGCLVRTPAGTITLPGHPVVAADTSGAGDAHCGAFLAALARGDSPATAAAAANVAAALSVTRPGPGTAPTLAEVRAAMHGSPGAMPPE